MGEGLGREGLGERGSRVRSDLIPISEIAFYFNHRVSCSEVT